MPSRVAGLLLLLCAVTMPASAFAMPGDPPFGPISPADGATLPVDPDAIAVRFSCPAYRVSDDGFVAVFGGAPEYGMRMSTSPALGPDGRLAEGTSNTALRDTVTAG